MNRKKVLCLFLAAMVMAMTMGCGKDKKENDASEPGVQETQANTEETKEETESVSQSVELDSITLYEEFMRGEEPVFMDKYYDLYENGTYAFLEPSYFLKDTPYYRDGFALGVAYVMGYEWNDEFSMEDVEYAYIDCGNDGEKELALLFNNIGTETADSYVIVIIKNIDNKLQVCHAIGYGYRSWAKLNPYGLITEEGSGGAALYGYYSKIIDENGDVQFLYSKEEMYSYWGLYLPWIEDMDKVIDKSGAPDDLMIVSFSFDEYTDSEDYEAYEKNKTYTYYQLEDEEVKSDPEIYKEDGVYRKLFAELGVNVVTPEEADLILTSNLEKKVSDKNLLSEEEVEWEFFYNPNIVKISEAESQGYKTYYIENPGWENFNCAEGADNPAIPTLELVSKEANEIIDDDVWLDSIGVSGFSFTSKYDDTYSYMLSGDEKYAPYIIDIISGDYIIAELNLKDFTTPPNIKAGDEVYVTEYVHDVKYCDGILYVSLSHMTYAESAPQNAYVIALDPSNDYRVIWKSEPLTCNSYNFAVEGDSIICGYGFTAEPDYIYVLDRFTGTRVYTYPVKTGPDYFFVKDDMLYVRTYDTNYVYKLVY